MFIKFAKDSITLLPLVATFKDHTIRYLCDVGGVLVFPPHLSRTHTIMWTTFSGYRNRTTGLLLLFNVFFYTDRFKRDRFRRANY